MKILAVCGSGIGTSMIMKTKLKKVLENLKIVDVEIESKSLDESKNKLDGYDYIICSDKIAKQLGESDNIIALGNLLDDFELEEKLSKILK